MEGFNSENVSLTDEEQMDINYTDPDKGPVNVTNSTNNESGLNTSYISDTWAVPTLLVIIIGTLGNMLSLLVFCRSRSKKTSFTVFVAAVAVADTCYLFVWFADTWLFMLNIDTRTSVVGCKMATYLRPTVSFMCSWFVTLMSLDRVFYTNYRRVVKIFNRKKPGKVICFIIVCVGLVYNVSSLVETVDLYQNETTTVCFQSDAISAWVYVFFDSWINPFLSYFIPSTVIVFASFATLKTVCQKSKNPIVNSTRENDCSTSNDNMFCVTLLVGVAFIALKTPLEIFLLVQRSAAFSIFAGTSTTFISLDVLHLLNYSMKFFIYTLSSKRFRRDLETLLDCRRDDALIANKKRVPLNLVLSKNMTSVSTNATDVSGSSDVNEMSVTVVM